MREGGSGFFSGGRAAEEGWDWRAERSGRGRGECGSFSGGGGSRRWLVWEGREVRLGTKRNWFLQRRRGQQKAVGVGGPRVQAGDEEKLVSSAVAGAAEDGWCGRAERSGRGRGESCLSDRSGGSGRLAGGGGLRCQTGDEEELVGSSGRRRPPTGVGVTTNCYDERNERRYERRWEKKEEKRVVLFRAGELSVYISGSPPA